MCPGELASSFGTRAYHTSYYFRTYSHVPMSNSTRIYGTLTPNISCVVAYHRRRRCDAVEACVPAD